MRKKQKQRREFRLSWFGPITLANIVDWLVTVNLLVLLATATLLLGGMRPGVLVAVSALSGSLCVLHALWIWLYSRRETFVLSRNVLVWVPLLAYLGLHALWLSPVRWSAQLEWLVWLLGFLVIWVVTHGLRLRSQIWTLLTGLSVIGGLAALEGFEQYFRKPAVLPLNLRLPEEVVGQATGPFTAPGSFAGLLVLLAFPLLVAAFSRRLSLILRIFAGYGALMFIVGTLLSQNLAALFALCAGLLLLPFYVGTSARQKVLGFLGVCGFIAAVGAGGWFLLPEFQGKVLLLLEQPLLDNERLSIWAAGWQLFLGQPVTGQGLSSFSTIFESQRPDGLIAVVDFAHNEYLNTLVELGVVGLLLLFGAGMIMLFLAWREWLRQPKWSATQPSAERGNRDRQRQGKRVPALRLFLGSILLAFAAFAVHLAFEFHFKTPALLLVTAALFGIINKCLPGLGRFELSRSGGTLAALFFLLGGLSVSVSGVRAFYTAHQVSEAEEILADIKRPYSKRVVKLVNAEETALMTELELVEHAREGARQAAARSPEYAPAWAVAAQATYELHRFAATQHFELGREMEAAMREAIALNDAVPDFWILLGKAAWLQLKMDEAQAHFERARALAPNNPLPLYWLGAVLAADSTQRDEALILIDRSLELYPTNFPASRLRQKLLIP